MATRVDYANGIDATDIGTIYLTGAGYVNYPFRGASRESALGWEEPVWGGELNRNIDLVLDVDNVDYGLVARCEISYKYLNVQDYKVLCKIAKQKVCKANFFNRETGTRVTQEMAFTGNEIGKLYKFGTEYLGVIDMAIKLVATNRDRQDIISATHTITYNANGGAGTIAQQSVKWAGQKTLADSGFTRTGNYTLIGWNTQADGYGEEYELGQSVTVFGNLTLYAVWATSATLPIGIDFRNNYIGPNSGSQDYVLDNNTVKEMTFDSYTGVNEYNVNGVNVIAGLTPTYLDENNLIALYKSTDGKKVFVLSPKNCVIKANEYCAHMFQSMVALTKINFNNFDTSDTINMDYMFQGLWNCDDLDLRTFNTSKVTSMYDMFSTYGGRTLNVSSFDTSNVHNMSYMFSYSTNLVELNLSNFDVSKVGLPYEEGDPDYGLFNPSIDYMFSNCNSLVSLDIPNFNPINAGTFLSLFARCSSLTTLDLSSFDMSNITATNYMFRDCSNLKTIYVSPDRPVWSLSNPNFGQSTFTGATSLVGGNGTTFAGTGIEYARIDGYNNTPGYFTAKV